MKYLIILLTFVSVISNAQVIDWEWTYEPNAESDSRAQNISVGLNEFVYVSGYFSDSIAFAYDTTYSVIDTLIVGIDTTYNTSDTTFSINQTCYSTNYGSYVAKFDTLGNFYWVKTIYSGNNTSIPSSTIPKLSSDINNNVYITASSDGNVIFEDETLINTKAFIAKLDVNGNYLWKLPIYSTGAVWPNKIGIDNNSDILFGGEFEKSLSIDTLGVDSIPGMYYPSRLFLSKLNTNGNCLKLSTALLSDDLMYGVDGMAVSNTGDCYLSGTTMSDIDFGNGVSTIGGFMEYPFIVKYDNNLEAKWVKQFASVVGFGQCGGITASNENVFVTGMYVADIGIDTFSISSDMYFMAEAFVSCIDTSGDVKWLKSFGSSADGGEQGFSMTSNYRNESFFISAFSDTIILGLDTLIASNVPTNFIGSDIFITKLDSAGDVIWGKRVGLAGDFNFGEIDCSAGGELLLAGFSINDTTKSIQENSFIGKSTENPIIVAIKQLSHFNEILLYPNPTSNDITIKSNELISSVKIYSITGELIDNVNNINGNKIVINLSDYIKGIYFLQIASSNSVQTKKVIQQ